MLLAGESAEDTLIGDRIGRTDSQNESPLSSPSARVISLWHYPLFHTASSYLLTFVNCFQIKTLSPALKKARTTASSSQGTILCHHLANFHLILIIIFNHLQDITVKQVLSGTPSQLASPRGALDAGTATPLPMMAPLTLPDSSFDEINLKQVIILSIWFHNIQSFHRLILFLLRHKTHWTTTCSPSNLEWLPQKRRKHHQ